MGRLPLGRAGHRRRLGQVRRGGRARQPDGVGAARDPGSLGHRRPGHLARRQQHRRSGEGERRYQADLRHLAHPGSLYVRPGESRGDAIVVADASGENPRELVSARGGWHTHWPAWSADGRFVYFSETTATWNGEPSEIFRVPAGGGEPQAVVRTTRRALFPLPSADGGLFYAANPAGVDLDLWWRASSEDEPQRLTTGVGEYAEPRVSADGRTLVATLIEYRQALVSVPVVFGGAVVLRRLTDEFGGDLEPSLSPRGGRMALSSSRSGRRNLWTAEPDGSNLRPLTSDAALEERPSLSPDAGQVAFVSDRGGQRGIWIVNSDGVASRRLVAAPVLDTLTWSPDGRQIAHAVPGGSVPQLSIVSVNDGAVRPLPTPAGGHSPAWSPRGDVVAYLEPRGPGRAYLKFVSSRGQPLYQGLPDGPPLTNGFVAWAPDGKRLVAVGVPGSSKATFWIVSPESSPPFRKLIELPEEVRPRGITWTSDGSALIFGRQETLSDLVLFERSTVN
ncbi:MAG: hypothetical protein DMF77_07085 [Acidobacteria bacterium]|nr:MAG: hypothetical protein DMF77_07085 [Acidobacteriota bacterium]